MTERFFFGIDEDKKVYSVAEINADVRSFLERRWSKIAVEAEIGDVKRPPSGHLYFTLLDAQGSGQLPAVMWKAQAQRYGKRILNGAKVRCLGRLTLYDVRGTFQMVVDSVADVGEGIKAQQLEQLKQKLFAEGLFDAKNKKPLPTFPFTVGVVTSKTGAAIRDIIKVVRRRFPVNILISHTQVQGLDAPGEIATALSLLESVDDVDVIIIGRGGGSAEDLDAFNTEIVVRAVAACKKPIVSAVGHEIDITLTDLAADCRAATPSEAAELVVPDGRTQAERIAQGQDALVFAIQRQLSDLEHSLSEMRGRVRAEDPRVRLRWSAERIAQARESLLRIPTMMLANALSSLNNTSSILLQWPKPALLQAKNQILRRQEPLNTVHLRIMSKAKSDFAEKVAKLEALSPLASLSRGYSVVRRVTDNMIVRDAADAPTGTEIDVTLSKGSLMCVVTNNKPSL